MPMDALARGFLGTEIAELINSFRFYKEDIDNFMNNFMQFLNVFKITFIKELTILKHAKSQIVNALLSNQSL